MSETLNYQTIKRSAQAEIRRGDSTFIAYLDPVESEEGVRARLAEIHAAHRAATHQCYAYRLNGLREALVERAADSGEPLHTAGQPLLQALQGRDLRDILLTVVRYFGGTKLGIGGLIRAYSDAAKAALSSAELVTQVPQMELRLQYPYTLTGVVMRVLNRHRAQIARIEYGERPSLCAQVARAQAEALERELRDATSGQIELELR